MADWDKIFLQCVSGEIPFGSEAPTPQPTQPTGNQQGSSKRRVPAGVPFRMVLRSQHDHVMSRKYSKGWTSDGPFLTNTDRAMLYQDYTYDMKKYKCSKCGGGFSEKATMEYHMKTCKSKDVPVKLDKTLMQIEKEHSYKKDKQN